MGVKIALPLPTSLDSSYNDRALPQYVHALLGAGASPVLIPLDASPQEIARLLARTRGALLPGSRYDIDPQKYGESRQLACNDPDPLRSAADELLLQDAFNLRKPVLGVCGGMQALSVWCNGTLIQDLAAEGLGSVNHAPGREVQEAHPIQVVAGSRLAAWLDSPDLRTQVNSSHHQAVRTAGDGTRVSAVSPGDGVVEAIEVGDPKHFAVGVQWHPERTYDSNAFSRAIFRAFVSEAERWQPIASVEASVRA